MNGNDSGPESLRFYIGEASTGDIINFDDSISTVNITGAELLIEEKSITIQGRGMGGVVVSRVSGDGRIFHVTENSTLNMSGVTVSNGNETGSGGGIFVDITSNLTLDHCIIINNNASTGGGIAVFDGFFQMIYCTVSFNTAATAVGGIALSSAGFYISHSTISNNSTSALYGGGILTENSPATNSIINSTIAYNIANTSGGGLYNNNDTLILTNVTIAYNEANDIGGGIYNLAGSIDIGNTIVANNNALTDGDTSGNFNSQGNNLIGNPGNANGFIGSDITNVDPMLGLLGNYGGPTLTIPLSQGSPALGGGNLSLLPPGEQLTDQRGPPYVRVFNGQLDIGSFEDQSAICFSGKSKILTRNILTNVVAELNAEDVFSDIHEVYDIIKHEFVPVKFNIIARKTTRFMLIKAHLIGHNQPFEDFYVTSGHKLLIKDEKIKARYVKGAIRVKVNPPEILYSICTAKAAVILVNGLGVATWGYDNWLRYAKKNGIGWKDNKPTFCYVNVTI